MNADYESKKSALLEIIRKIRELDASASDKLERIAHDLQSNSFTMAVLGQFKRGKSTLVNAILGESLLPTAILPLTSIITVIRHSDMPSIKVVFQSGDSLPIDKNALADYVTEKGNPKNIKRVERVEINTPSDFLSKGIVLVDTPGIGSVYHHNTDITYQFLPEVDAALFVISADPPISDAECKFLEESAKYASKFFFVLNKTDYLEPGEIEELLEFNRNVISQKTGNAYAEAPILPLSAKRALEAKAANDMEGLKKSGLLELEAEVERFVTSEKGTFILRSSGSKIKAVAQALINHRLIEKGALEISQKELEARTKRFEAELEDILSQKDYSSDLLNVEQKKILDKIDADLAELKRRSTPELVEKISNYANSLPVSNNSEFAAAVDDYRQEAILHVLEHWRNDEEAKVSRLFSEKMGKYSAAIDRTIDKIEGLASEMFEVKIKNVRTEEGLTLESRFYFKLSRMDEISTFSGITLSGVELLLPHAMFRKRFISKIPAEVEEDLERNSGRMRSDFLERIQKSALDFKWTLDEKIDAVIAGIRDANERAFKIKNAGKEKVEGRKRELESEIAQLENIVGALMEL